MTFSNFCFLFASFFPNKQRMTEHRTIRKMNRKKNIVIHIMGKFPSYSTEKKIRKVSFFPSLHCVLNGKLIFLIHCHHFVFLHPPFFSFQLCRGTFLKTRREKTLEYNRGNDFHFSLSSLFRTINNEQKKRKTSHIFFLFLYFRFSEFLFVV